MHPGKEYIGVGCGAIIINSNNEVLLVKRADSARVEPGMWARPGGGVEFGETVAQAVEREVQEEVGIVVKAVRPLEFTEMISGDKAQHWIALGYLAEYISGEPKNLEPDKHDEVKWFPLDKLPPHLAAYTKNSIEVYLKTVHQ